MKPILLISALVVGAGFVYGDAKADLQKLYAGLAGAIKKKDLKTCMSYLASDYSDVDVKGKKMTRKEFETMVKAQFAAPITVQSFDITVTKVTAKGTELIAENTGKMVLTLQNPQAKKTSKLEQTSTHRDTWVKSGSKWLLKSSKTLTQKRTLDGKVIPG